MCTHKKPTPHRQLGTGTRAQSSCHQQPKNEKKSVHKINIDCKNMRNVEEGEEEEKDWEGGGEGGGG